MRWMILSVLILGFTPDIAAAQSVDLDIVKDPVCFKVRNEAPYKVYGNLVTAQFPLPTGGHSRHRSNFRLDEAGAKDAETGEASDVAEFCSYGPFFEGRKLELVIRTLFPVFDCKTRIDRGEIVITGYRKPEGGAVTEAKCFTE